MKVKNKIHIGLFIVCLLITLNGMNKPHLSPFTTHVQFENLSILAESEDHLVALDRYQDRLLIGNREGKLLSVVDMTKAGSHTEKISGIALNGDSIYVIGSTNFYEGSYLSSENVLLYNTHGKFIRELYKQEYAPEDFQSKYVLESIISGESDTTLACIEGLTFFPLYSIPDDVVNHMDYSCSFMLYNILFWFSLVVIAAALLYVLLKVMSRLTPKELKSMPAAVLVALIAAGFYTHSSFRQIEEQYEHIISTQTSQYSYLLTRLCQQEHILRDSIPSGMKDMVFELISSLNKTHGVEQSIYSSVFLVDKDGNISTFVDCQDNMTPGIVMGNINDSTYVLQDRPILQMETSYGNYIYDRAVFYDVEGSVIGVVGAACSHDNLIKLQMDSGIKLFFSLLCIFIVLFVSTSVFRTFRNDIARYRSRDVSQFTQKIVDMSGIMMFAIYLTMFLDKIAVVYIAQSMCETLSQAQQAAMIAIPLAACNAGQWVGSLVYPSMRSRLNDRIIALIAGIGSIAALLVIIFSIQISSVIVFATGKLLSGIFLGGILFMSIDNMPLYADNDHDAHHALNSSKNASVAANVFGLVLGGYMAEYISYSAIYIMAAILVITMIIVLMIIYRGEKSPAQTFGKPAVKTGKSGWRYFFTLPMISFILFYSLPRMLICGYVDYLFPLFSVSCGISVVILSNITVFSKTLCYILNDTITSFTGKYGNAKVMLGSLFAACFGIVTVFISPNIYWAIATVFIIDIACRISRTTYTMYLRSLATKMHYDPIDVVSRQSIASNALYVAQTPVLSAFIPLGFNAACGIVGTIAGLLLTCFAFLKKSFGKYQKKLI